MKYLFHNQLTLLVVALLSLACCTNEAKSSETEEIASAFFKGRFSEAISLYSNLPPVDRRNPHVLFWTGVSYMRQYDYKQAEAFLQLAVNGDLTEHQKQVASSTLQRIHTISTLCPPLQKHYSSNGFRINIYAADNDWSRGLGAQMPIFLERANEAFAGESAEINFYLFDQRPPYDRFFSAWTNDSNSSDKHRGTGVMHTVEFCQFYPTGIKIGAQDVRDLYSRVLHEYCHALCNTIYGDSFLRDCPQWLNESMADIFGWKFRPELPAKQTAGLTNSATKAPPLSYDMLCHHVYDEPRGYLIPDVLLLELLQGRGVSCYKQIINTARQNGGDFELAIRSVTGKDPRTVYQGIVQRYWKN